MNKTPEEEINDLKERNVRVELDKKWEKSWARRISIAVITYFVATFWLYTIDGPDIWLNAVVPTVGYILSTLSIPVLKNLWVKSQKTK